MHEQDERAFKGIWIPKEIWLSKDLTIQEKLMLVEIDSLDNDDGCFASNKYFSNFFGISTARISQIINELAKKGYLKITYQKEGKQTLGRIIKIQSPPFPRVLNIFNRGIKFPKEGIKFPKEGYLENLKDNNIVNNNINNNILKENYNKRKNEVENLESKFNAFWKEYPKKVSKENARKWFIKNNPSDELFNKMIKSLERFKKLDDWKKQNGKYIPYPSTWLNQKRWEDEFETDEEKINRIFDELED